MLTNSINKLGMYITIDMVDPEELGNPCLVIISLILGRKSLLSGGRFLSAVRKCHLRFSGARSLWVFETYPLTLITTVNHSSKARLFFY